MISFALVVVILAQQKPPAHIHRLRFLPFLLSFPQGIYLSACNSNGPLCLFPVLIHNANMGSGRYIGILGQGVKAWNQWRTENPDQRPDLSRAEFDGLDLADVNLSRADLLGVSFFKTNLRGARLTGANLHNVICGHAILTRADFTGANVSSADFGGAFVRKANFTNANLKAADFSFANLTDANLTNANLTDATFFHTNLTGATLTNANFTGALMKAAVLGRNDLSTAVGLETVEHGSPSTIGIDTICLSAGKIPPAFLRRAGIPEDFIQFITYRFSEDSAQGHHGQS